VKIASQIGLTMHQARWPKPPIRIILQQFGAEHCRFYLAPGDLLGKRFLGCVESYLDLVLIHCPFEQI
jgi:hypothetical protein